MPTPATNPRTVNGTDMADGPSPTVVGFDQTEAGVDDIDRWTELARETLIGERVAVGQLDLIFVDADQIAELNRLHMGHHGPTDVLSFPLDAEDAAEDGGPDLDVAVGDGAPAGDDEPLLDGGPPIHLGDVVICPSVAADQAPGHCGTTEAELSLLVIHGVLHVLGHDHAEPAEAERMQARERHHLARSGFDHPVPA